MAALPEPAVDALGQTPVATELDAGRIAPDDDPRAVVDALRAANGGRAELEVGTRLDLAVG